MARRSSRLDGVRRGQRGAAGHPVADRAQRGRQQGGRQQLHDADQARRARPLRRRRRRGGRRTRRRTPPRRRSRRRRAPGAGGGRGPAAQTRTPPVAAVVGGTAPVTLAGTMPRVTELDWPDLASGIALVATDLDGTLLRPDCTVSAFTVDTLAASPRREAAGGVRDRSTAPLDRCRSPRPPGTPAWASAPTARSWSTSPRARSPSRSRSTPTCSTRWSRRCAPRCRASASRSSGRPLDSATPRPSPTSAAFRPRVPARAGATTATSASSPRGRRVIKLLARVEGGAPRRRHVVDLAVGHVEHLVTVTHSELRRRAARDERARRQEGHGAGAARARAGVPLPPSAAVGDMPNDVPMLAWAGVGLGVEGAHPLVCAAADAVLPAPERRRRRPLRRRRGRSRQLPDRPVAARERSSPVCDGASTPAPDRVTVVTFVPIPSRDRAPRRDPARGRLPTVPRRSPPPGSAGHGRRAQSPGSRARRAGDPSTPGRITDGLAAPRRAPL